MASNTLGETFEELIQDTFGSVWESTITGKGDPITLSSIGDTVTSTIGVGLLMTLFGLPGNMKSYASARVVETSFNEAVEAYERGDTAAYEAALEKLRPALSNAILNLTEDFRTGEIDRQAELIQIDENIQTNLDDMENAMRMSLELRQRKESGQKVSQGIIDLMDARANSAISRLRSMNGVTESPATLYDQIMNDPALVQMINNGGLTADFIQQNGNVLLNDSQIELLKKIEAAAQSNPNINVKFSADTTVETLQKRAAKYEEKETSTQAEFKSLNDSVTQQLREAYNNSPEEGKAKYKELADNGTFKRLASLRKTADKAGQRLADATAKASAFNAQQGFRQMFDMAARGETIAPENVRPQAEQQPVQAPVSPVAGTSQRIEQTPPAIEPTQESASVQAQNRTIAYEGSINDIVGSAKPSERVKKTAESAKGRESINAEWSGLREDEKIAKVLGSTKQARPPLKESLREGINLLRRQLTDTGQAWWDGGKEMGDNLLYPMYNHAKQSAFAAQSMIGTAQRDMEGNIVGPSLMEIYKPITDAGVENRVLADTYVYHLHNIDRMSLESRAMQEYADYVNETIGEDALSDEELATLIKQEGPDAVMFKRLQELRNNVEAVKNKPVFGEGVTAAVSERMIAEMDAQNPELKQFAEQLIAYHRNLLQLKLETHMISQEEFDYLTTKYPHYVPTDRFIPTTKGMYALGRSISIADTIRVAKGSNLDLMPLDESSARKTIRDLEAINKNLLMIRLFNDAMDNPDTAGRYVEAVEVETSDYDPDTEETQKPALPNSLTFYMDGEKVTMKVSAPIFFGMNEMTNTFKEYNILTRASETVNTVFKQLITGYNPVFSARNGIRDLSAAGLNTKFSEAMFVKNWAIAALEVTTPKLSPYKGEMWQLYKSMGGIGDTFFDYKTGKIKAPSQSNIVNIAKKANPVHLIEVANMAIEQLPRMAEFMATLESGGMSYENKIQALYNAAEVTVNFGRSGKAARFLNKTFVPFLNPSIQGASRFVRRFTETKGSKQWISLIGRVAALGILPSVINALLYSGDDEWEREITDRDKNRYYMFKLGDGYWLQIPKGREVSLFGAISNQLLGLQDADGWGIINLAAEQVAPVSPLESNILSPWLQAANNKTWYGTPIESESMQSLAPGQRYDESTDAFSKWLGSVTNWSPKKTNYIIDAYTGVIGDFLLPLSTPKAEQGGILAPVISAFTLDVKTTNKLSTQFYDEVEQIKYRMNGTDKRDAAKAKSENTIIQRYVSDISELNKLVHETQNSNIPDAEKLAKVRDLRATIAGLQKEALERLKK
ncbi:MAG: LPD38 domain-containing protein [Phycisphaerae bacterium]